MEKDFIFLTSGDAPDLGFFSRGQVRKVEDYEVKEHVKRNTIKAVEDLVKDECRHFFFEINVNDLPDSIKVADMQDLLILTKEVIKKGIDLPEKITLDKVKKLLNMEVEEAPEKNKTKEGVKDDE